MIRFAGFVFFVAASTYAMPAQFHSITGNLYRGARPTENDLRELSNQGIGLDLDLEDSLPTVRAESGAANAVGIKFVNIPLNAAVTPRDRDVNRALAEMGTSGSGKIFLHCHYGEDRTGLLSALYRVEVQGWSAQDAYREMMANGFNMKYAKPLEIYFRHRTGYSGN
jgi:protein tyrosine/serine phosphatase